MNTWIGGLIAFLLSLALVIPAFSQKDPGDISASERETMVRTQLEARDITDATVLAAMQKVPRHWFVPAELRLQAYDDGPLPIGEGQTISQPYIVAFMTEQLRLKGGEKVLEIGTGSGYQAAILGEICAEVYTIEIVDTLAKRSVALLQQIGR